MIKTLFFCSILIQLSTVSSAYNLYKTPNGMSVLWNTAEVEILLDPSLSALGLMDRIEVTIEESFARWQLEGEVPIQFTIIRDECRELANDGNNCIFACTDASDCPRDEKDKGAGAFVSVDPETGVIQDVDIVFNAVDWHWDSNGHKEHSLNLAAVMTHEIGHALGIDHSADENAVMYARISTDEDASPALRADDIAAAQTLYENFNPQSEETYGCSVAAPGGAPKWSAVLGIFGVFSVVLIRRGRKERR